MLAISLVACANQPANEPEPEKEEEVVEEVKKDEQVVLLEEIRDLLKKEK